MVTKVMSKPPTIKTMPRTISENPTASLCLDSAAFSCRYSLIDIVLTLILWIDR
jgi:hypothetical protein